MEWWCILLQWCVRASEGHQGGVMVESAEWGGQRRCLTLTRRHLRYLLILAISCRKSEVAKTRFFRPRGQANFLTHNFYFYEFYYQFRPMTNTSPNRSPWTTLNKPTLSSCRALVIICLDHAPGSKEWTFIDSGTLMNRDFDTVPFRKKTQLINNEKIHGKVARVWC